MAFPASVCRAVFEFTLANGSGGFVTPHFVQSAGSDYTQAELDGLVVQLADWATTANYSTFTNASLISKMSNSIQLTSITCTSLAAVPIQAQISPAATGPIANDPLPNESAAVVTLRTGFIGRSYRGRNFWPVLSVASMDPDGTLDAPTVTALQDCFDALIGGIEIETNSEVAVFSPTLNLVTPVTSAIVRSTVHHQRRRNS